MKNFERLLLSLFILTAVLKQFHIAGADLVSILSFTIAAMFYYVLTFYVLTEVPLTKALKKETYEKIHPLKIIAGIAFGWDLSVLIMGVFFKFMLFPGAESMLTYGLTVQLIFLILFAYQYKKTVDNYFRKALYRIMIIGGIAFAFKSINANQIIDMRYGEYPEYADICKRAYADPFNETLILERDSIYMQTFGKKE